MDRLPIGYAIRLGVVVRVHNTYIVCEYMDNSKDLKVQCPKPHPYASQNGSGIFIGVDIGDVVMIALAPGQDPYIAGIVPDRSMYFDSSGVSGIRTGTSEYPNLSSGEVCLKGKLGSMLYLKKNGNVAIDAGLGTKTYDIELSKLSRALYLRTDNIYQFTNAGRKIDGVVRRCHSKKEDPNDTVSIDFMAGERYDELLDTIGRFPDEEINIKTDTLVKKTIRNPPLVEKREITYEYSDEFGVRFLEHEANAFSSSSDGKDPQGDADSIQIPASPREQRRTDILDLNLRNYNHLIEKVEGTVVDIYGNILDINRNIIKIPDAAKMDPKFPSESLKRLYSFLRRSVKYHFEINSRKDTDESAEPSIDVPGYNAKDHSRWSLDVDGEGLTKINIPSSSETGNIPVLGRHIVSRDTRGNGEFLDNGNFKDGEDTDKSSDGSKDRRDIRTIQFGAKKSENEFAGQKIANSEYIPVSVSTGDNKPPTVTAGTAYHDLLNIASSIFNNGKLKNPEADWDKDSVPPMVFDINNQIPEINGSGRYNTSSNPNANAGGRSVHANLDGSIEMSIGADTSDRKSIVLDTAGAMIAHYGRDRNGRSIIQQTDGDVIIQIGGKGISGDSRFTSPEDTNDRPGRIEIHLNVPGDGPNHRIIIDENGMTLDMQGDTVFRSNGNFAISAKANLLLSGEQIHTYGHVEADTLKTRIIGKGERLITRKGRSI